MAGNMVNRVLMIAYHYPPCNDSTGWQRTHFFAKYLPNFGWDPVVLTAIEKVYNIQLKSLLSE